MRVEISLGALVVLVTAIVAPCRAQEIGIEEAFPLRGTTETLTVEAANGQAIAGAVVSVTYRPNSQTARTIQLDPTDTSGQTLWTVEDAGIVSLTAVASDGQSLASLTVAVRYGGMPASGIAVMVVAGGLLFGGALLGFVLLMRKPPHIPKHEPPST